MKDYRIFIPNRLIFEEKPPIDLGDWKKDTKEISRLGTESWEKKRVSKFAKSEEEKQELIKESERLDREEKKICEKLKNKITKIQDGNILREIAFDETVSMDIKEVVLSQPRTPEDVIREFLTYGLRGQPNLLLAIAKNPSAPGDVLEEVVVFLLRDGRVTMLGNHPTEERVEILSMLVKNPSSTAKVLAIIERSLEKDLPGEDKPLLRKHPNYDKDYFKKLEKK